MSQLIYIETSIPSFYHETRAAGPFQTMREWWDIAKVRATLVVFAGGLRAGARTLGGDWGIEFLIQTDTLKA